MQKLLLSASWDHDGHNYGKNMAKALVVLFVHVARAPFALVAGLPAIILLIRYSGLTFIEAMVASTPIVATTMAGFVLNDVFDVYGDRNSIRYKALAKKDVSLRVASIFAAGLCLLAIVSAFPTKHGNSVLVVFFALFGVVIYSPLVRRIPIVKDLLTGVLSCSSILYGAEMAGLSVPCFYYIFLFAFVLGRELLLDVQDFRRDQLAGMNTFAAYVGLKCARLVGWSLMLAGVLIVTLRATGLPFAFYISSLIALIACICMYSWSEKSGLNWSNGAFLIAAIGVSLAV